MNSCTEDEKPIVSETCPFADESPLSSHFFLAMHALWFDENPNPEMDALPLAQLRLLWTVYAAPYRTMKDYSERLFVAQSTVTQLADRLVHRGFIERQPDTQDRRVVRLKMSERGKQLLTATDAPRKELVQAVWERMGAEEQETTIFALKQMISLAETLRKERGRPLPSLLSLRHLQAPKAEALEAASPKPMLDIMSRSVRGKAS